MLREQSELVPLVPLPPHAAEAMYRAELGALSGDQLKPTGGTSTARDLDTVISTPQESRMIPRTVPVETPPRPLLLPALPPSADPGGMSGSVQMMAMREGIMLGGAVAAAMPGDTTKFWSRAAIGSGVGMLAGLSAGSALVRSWDSEEGYTDSGERLRQGSSTISTVAGGMLGTILGVATGAALRNSVDNFDNEDAARITVAGNITGLFVGYLLSSPVQ